MTTDARLREQVRAYSADLELTTATISVDEVRRAAEVPRLVRRRNPWQFVAAGFATALAIALVVLLVSGLLGGEDGTNTTARPVTGPKHVLALTADGRLVALAANDGREVRVVAEGIPVGLGEGQSLQVSPDRSAAYFLRATTGTCNGAPITELVRASLETGTLDTVATNARWPALSPNGRFLAYTGIPNCSDAGRSILVLDTETRESKEFTTQAWEVRAGIGYIAWAPDSRHLTYAPFDAFGGSFPRLLDTSGDAPLDTNPRILNPDGSRVQGYLGTTGKFLGTRAPGGNEPQQLGVVTFNEVSGEIDRVLFRLPEQCCGQTVTADETGRHVLAAGTFPSALYRWSQGDREPRKIAEDIVSAAWLPPYDALLEIRVLPSLRFDQDDYTVERGVIQIRYVNEGGSHVLILDEGQSHDLRLVTHGGDVEVGKARLEPGRYRVFCEIPGHRQAGEEATITVV